ncbi:MAG: glycosyltransferase family 2 protein [Methylophilaceae bacterium]
MTIKVSIIVPVYNVEKYLEECLLSAVNQDYENKEIILIDDGSTDSSAHIIEWFQSQYSFVKSVKTENQGQSAARNLGLELATGDFILFLDSDDWFDSHTVSLCVSKINENSLDIVLFSALAFIDGAVHGSEHVHKQYMRLKAISDKVVSSNELFTLEIKSNTYIVQPCMYMFNRSKFVNLRFYPGIIYEDNLFTTQLLLQHQDARVMCLQDTLFHRRFRPLSTMTQSKQQRHIDGHLVVIDELIKMVPQYKGSEQSTLKQLITNLLFEMLLILNPVYGWHIPLKIRQKILTVYLKYGLLPFKVKLFFKFMIPGSFSLWKALKVKFMTSTTNI